VFSAKILAIWQHNKRVFGLFFTAHAQKRLFASFRSKIWARHSLRRPRFPIRQMHFHYRVPFTGYIRCFSATTSHGLVTLTFDLLTLRVFRIQCFSCPTHIPIFIILRLLVTELRVLNIWSHFRYLKQSLRMRSITWPVHRRSPKTTRNNFLNQNCNFYGATMMTKGSLYWSNPHVKAVFGRKKQSPVKIGPQNGGFSEI